MATPQEHPFALPGAPVLKGAVWAAPGSRPAVLLVPGARPSVLTEFSIGLARAGFAAVCWEYGAGTEGIRRVTEALASGGLPVRAAAYAILSVGEGARDAIVWTASEKRVRALITYDVTSTPEHRSSVLESARGITCPWLLVADESDQQGWTEATLLARGGAARVVEPRTRDQSPLRIVLPWLSRNA